MRLLLIASEFPPGPGGIGTHAYHVASQLRQRGWDVVVLTPQHYVAADEVKAFNESQPFPIVSLRSIPGAPLEAVYRWCVASAWIKRWQPDVIIATGERSVWLTSWLTSGRPTPWVAIGHGTEFGATAGWERWLTRRSFERATAVVCVSEYTRQRMDAMGIRPRRTVVIPNGADATQFRVLPWSDVDRFRAEIGLNGARVLLTVGNVTERKGQDVVIRALPEILRRVPDTIYLIAGLPTRQAAFARLAADLGVVDHVRFLGRVAPADLVRYLNCCDVFVMTSRHTDDGDFEGYGIAVVEAAVCGKPAVVSANCGLHEAIVDGQTGLAVPEDDPARTARAILALLEDDERRRTMGEAARRRAVQEQTWVHRAAAYDALLSDLVDRKVPSPDAKPLADVQGGRR
jgi:phosphatidylinositol alpha-1,6-mannosyltransferase